MAGMIKFSRRNFLQGTSAIAIASVMPKPIEAGLHLHGSSGGTPTGRVVLNLNEPNYYNKLYPWLDIWKNSEGDIQFQNGGGTALFRTGAPPGGFSFGVASSYGICTDNNGECIDMSVTAPSVTQFTKTINQNDGGFLPPQLS